MTARYKNNRDIPYTIAYNNECPSYKLAEITLYYINGQYGTESSIKTTTQIPTGSGISSGEVRVGTETVQTGSTIRSYISPSEGTC